VTKTLPDEMIAGNDCRHYAYAVNKEEAKNFIAEVNTILAGGNSADVKTNTDAYADPEYSWDDYIQS